MPESKAPPGSTSSMAAAALASEVSKPLAYQYEALSDDALAEICRLGLERGELWRPDVKVFQQADGFLWFDSEDGAPQMTGPFPSAREALIDAIETEGVEDPVFWGLQQRKYDSKQAATEAACKAHGIEVRHSGTQQKSADAEGAQLFFDELLQSVESLEGIADEYGVRTLVNLMFLQQAVLKGTYIDHDAGEDGVLDVLSSLPSGSRWKHFVKVDEPESAPSLRM